MKLVVPFGFYGSGNIGDEATLSGFARLLSHGPPPVPASIASRDPAHTARVEPAFRYFTPSGFDPRRWWAKARASACVFAGGTPIMDMLGDWPLCEVVPQIQAAARRRCPIVFLGIGTEPLQHAKSRRIFAEQISPHVRWWTVRCEHDRTRLIEYGAAPETITVAADMAWLIEPATRDFGRQRLRELGLDQQPNVPPVIAVNLVNENEVLDQQPQIVAELARALDELVETRSAKILFLSNEVRLHATFDTAAARLVIAKMKHGGASAVLAPNDYLSPRQMMSIIGCCDLAISMRYHFCLFAALQGVPFVALMRSDKLKDLCYDLDWPAAVKPAGLQAAELLSQIGHAEKVTVARLPDRISLMRRRALRNLAALHAVGAAARRQPAPETSLVSP
jgi:polysaccharide pyruvyl transferase WcaK-like protein